MNFELLPVGKEDLALYKAMGQEAFQKANEGRGYRQWQFLKSA